MTGPEHYRGAEHAIEEAQDPASPEDRTFLMAEAQVHATLALIALAAAAAEAFVPSLHFGPWAEVIR